MADFFTLPLDVVGLITGAWYLFLCWLKNFFLKKKNLAMLDIRALFLLRCVSRSMRDRISRSPVVCSECYKANAIPMLSKVSFERLIFFFKKNHLACRSFLDSVVSRCGPCTNFLCFLPPCVMQGSIFVRSHFQEIPKMLLHWLPSLVLQYDWWDLELLYSIAFHSLSFSCTQKTIKSVYNYQALKS